MQYLTVELSDSSDNMATVEVLACTAAEHHGAALAEAQTLLQWMGRECPGSPGPVDDGHAWDHDLQITQDAGQWHTLALTLTAPQAVLAEMLRNFDLE
jgi:hypothetical protein